jgi:putative ABC transport system substrate-binding protein
VRRRNFIGGLGCAAAMPLAARAQSERVRRIGILMPYPPGDAEKRAHVRALRDELRKRGWASGVNVQFDERWAGDDMDQIRASAENLVELNPDAILAVGGRVIPILMKLTSVIPIIIPGGTDPVERGYVRSLARPGGNVTGFAIMEASVIGKQLQTLKEIAPHLGRMVMIYNPDNPSGAFTSRSFAEAARPLGIETAIAHIHGLPDIEQAAAAVASQANSGIFIPLDVTIDEFAEQTVAAIARHGIPAVYPERFFVDKGGLVSYGTDRPGLYRSAASYVDRILRGEKPAEMPIEQPSSFELVINLRTARALGVEIPAALLARADEVIE